MVDICPSAEKCPVYDGSLVDENFTTEYYKETYCEAGPEARGECRRFQSKEKYGKVPDGLLPNATITVEEIGIENNWS